MDNQIYQSPEASLTTEDESLLHEFYVVSTRKFCILFLLTVGFYLIYWFYKNWHQYKMKHAEDMWPVARAIFNIFFVHSLFENIKLALENKNIEFSWSPNLRVISYIALSITNIVADRMSANNLGSPYSDVTSIVILPFFLLIFIRVQKAINISQGDEFGTSNNSFSAANIFWCALGGVLWLFAIIGIMTVFNIISLA